MTDDATVWWAVTIDCRDPHLLATFWAELLGTPIVELGGERAEWRRLHPFAPNGPFLNFQPVPESKAGKARIHLDVLVADLDAGVARVLELGGRDTGARELLARGRIAVMRDPEGNEFCLLSPPEQASDG